MSLPKGFGLALKTPCKDCPFRCDKPGYILEDRAREIGEAVVAGENFHCHKTLNYEGECDGVDIVANSPQRQMCGGAMILAEKVNKGREGGPGVLVNQFARIANRMGLFNPDDLDVDAPVFNSVQEMVEHNRSKKSGR